VVRFHGRSDLKRTCRDQATEEAGYQVFPTSSSSVATRSSHDLLIKLIEEDDGLRSHAASTLVSGWAARLVRRVSDCLRCAAFSPVVRR
jgi:hypothetical protein